MKFTIPCAELAACLKSHVAVRRSTLPVLDHCKIEADADGVVIETTDLQCYVRTRLPAQVAAPGAALLHLGKLSAAINANGDATITTGRVVRGRSSLAIPTIADVAEFPTPPDDQFADITLTASDLALAIDHCGGGVDPNDIREMCQALALKSCRAFGVRGHRVSTIVIDYDGPLLMIPGGNLARLRPLLETSGDVRFQIANVHSGRAGAFRVIVGGTTVTINMVNGEPLDIGVFLRQNKADITPIRVNTRALLEAIRRFKPFSEIKGTKGTHGARVVFAPGASSMSLADNLESLDSVVLEVSSERVVGANLDDLGDVLSDIPCASSDLYIRSSDAPIIVRPTEELPCNPIHVLSPMRI